MANSIMDAAEKLGRLIGESEEKKKAMETADALRNDAKASEIMMEYNSIRQKEMTRLQEKEPTKEELEEFQTLMQNEFKKLAENPVISAYIEANKEYDALVRRVNGVLGYYINGEETEQGCSGSCSSCSGCH